MSKLYVITSCFKMAVLSCVITFFCIFSAFYTCDCSNYQPRAIHLTEDTWQDILQGEWMVEFMAPWCPACRAFQETWDGFAKKWSRDLDIQVGVVDVTANPGLSGRFLITALPSIYHVKNGVFRQYVSGRTESDLITFIDDKRWQDVQAVSKWIAPDSIQMSMVALFFRMAMKIRAFYTLMTEVYGIPEWGCYIIFAIITIVTGLLLGLLLVCLCDLFSPTKQIPPPIPQGLMQPHLDKEGDIIDDTQTADGDTPVRRRNVQKSTDADKSNDKEDDADTEAKDEKTNEQTDEKESKKAQ